MHPALMEILKKTPQSQKTERQEEAAEESLEYLKSIICNKEQIMTFIERELLGFPYKKWQRVFMSDILDHLIGSVDKEQSVKRFAVVGAHGVGKTKFISVIIVYYMIFCSIVYKGEVFKGVMFAANEKQVKALWKTLESTARSMKTQYVISDGSKLVIDPQYIPKGSYQDIRFEWRTWSETAGGIAGIHGKNVMVYFDEAVEIPTYVYDKVATYFTSCKGLFIATANPVRTSCEFHRIYEKYKDQTDGLWDVRRISRYDFEDVANGGCAYSESIQKEDPVIDLKNPDSGLHNKKWRETVLGLFTLHMEGAVFPAAMLLEARERFARPRPEDRYYIGVDVATENGADKSVVVIRSDTQVVEILIEARIEVENALFALVQQKVYQYSPKLVAIDRTGMGEGFAEKCSRHLRLKDGRKAPLHCIHGGHGASNPLKHANKPTQCYYNLRDWIKYAGGLPDNKELIEELEAFTNVSSDTSRAEYRICSKDLIKTQIGRSPDISDALAYSCVETFHIETEIRKQREEERIKRGRRRTHFEH
jgi:hypothetical protein